jgi:hypothetical protein
MSARVVRVKRGELVAVRERRSVTRIGEASETFEEWTAGIATSTTRGGLVKAWRDAAGAVRRVERPGHGDVLATGLPGAVLEHVRGQLPVASKAELVALLKPFRR